MKLNQEFSRVNRPVQAAESYYSRLSRVYDLLASSEKRFIRQGLDLLDPHPGEMILKIGFVGPGIPSSASHRPSEEVSAPVWIFRSAWARLLKRGCSEPGSWNRWGWCRATLCQFLFRTTFLMQFFPASLWNYLIVRSFLRSCRNAAGY